MSIVRKKPNRHTKRSQFSSLGGSLKSVQHIINCAAAVELPLSIYEEDSLKKISEKTNSKVWVTKNKLRGNKCGYGSGRFIVNDNPFSAVCIPSEDKCLFPNRDGKGN